MPVMVVSITGPQRQKKRYFRHFASLLPISRSKWRLVCKLKGRGWRINFMPEDSGVRSPLRLLHAWQQATRFSQVDFPCCDLGITWSSVSSEAGSTRPQN